MITQTYHFGPNETLTSVLTLPAQRDAETPIAIILNAGIVHRAGPFRLHVDIARALASKGIASLRMDLSGLGDSDIRRELPDGKDRAILDVTDAMNALESSHNARQFVLMGLCSGAYNAHQVCLSDSRVDGGVFMDGLVYETPQHKRRTLKRRLRYRFLRNAIKKRLDPNALHSDEDNDSAEFFNNDKPANEVSSEIRSMLGRQMQLLYIYTEGYREISCARQFNEMFDIEPDGRQLQVDYYPNFEHTFRLTRHRSIIVERIAAWFQDRYVSNLEAAVG